MKKILFIIGMVLLCKGAWAANQPILIGDTVSAQGASSITDMNTTHYCRAIWIGTTQSIDIYFNNNAGWVTFQGATAGTVIPAQANGVRITSGPAAPNAGDVVCLN